MSLKGNVAGLGLGELLQSLARGGRDGALTLYGSGLHAVLGFQDGQIFLMPNEDESEELWRRRCRDAWFADPSPQLEGNRRAIIAHAARLETVYSMLELENLHFSFWPGRLSQYREAQKAKRTAKEAEEGVGLPGITEEDWGPGLSVEAVLLEHARLSDETKQGPRYVVTPWDVPLAFDDTGAREGRSFYAHCDGHSTLLEIADRLGSPTTQAFVDARNLIASGRIRLCSPRELLGSAQAELEGGHRSRAASRFVGWVRSPDCGPLEQVDADMLLGQWEDGRLPQVLEAMPVREARALLRRLDLVAQDRRSMIDRWGALHTAQRTDARVTLRWLVLRAADASVEGKPPFAELLRLARHFGDHRRWMRAGTVLRIAAGLKPSRLNHRLELGTRLIEAGLVSDGSRWLLDAAREMIDLRQGDKAVIPLRAVLEADPSNREARGLQMQARLRSAGSKKRRRNSIVALAVVLVFSVAALVQVRSEQQSRRKLDEINLESSDPAVALEKLEAYFPGDTSSSVENMRQVLQRRLREQQKRAEEEWLDRFETVKQESELGDPLLGVRRSLALPEPPDTTGDKANWPQRFEIFHALIARFQNRSNELDLSTDGSIEERHAEERFATLLEEVLALLDKEGVKTPDVVNFRTGVDSILLGIRTRQEQRAQEREKREQREQEQQMDMLLAAARAHHQAGDIERAQSTYERFLALDTTGDLREYLAPEIRGVEEHYQAYVKARDRAWAGDHVGALGLLQAHGSDGEPVCANPAEHMLPWRVTSEPDGARAVFPDGLERVAPFTYESAFGERISIRFTMDGAEDRAIKIDGPTDLLVRMHQLPERIWPTDYRVEALPLAYQNDHIVCDRRGRIARVSESGEAVWQREFPTLGGVAKSPVFLPAKRGHMLIVSEDGKAWVLEAATGADASQWSAGSPLVEGPLVRSRGAIARFRDGRVAEWTDATEPTVYTSEKMFTLPDNPIDSRNQGLDTAGSLTALYQKAGAGSSLSSPWNDWVVEVYEEEYVVRRSGSSAGGFSVSRHGDWTFVAWEMPNSRLARGRLWVSDGTGLRSYLPPR